MGMVTVIALFLFVDFGCKKEKTDFILMWMGTITFIREHTQHKNIKYLHK